MSNDGTDETQLAAVSAADATLAAEAAKIPEYVPLDLSKLLFKQCYLLFRLIITLSQGIVIVI